MRVVSGEIYRKIAHLDWRELSLEYERLTLALEEALPECWDTPAAEAIVREALFPVSRNTQDPTCTPDAPLK